MMRLLTILVILAGLGWSAYWAVGRMTVVRGIASGVAEARLQGWDIAWDDLSVVGFPNRFDTKVAGLSAQGPGGWGVVVPRLEVLALSYRPNEVQAAAATPLTVATPIGPVEATAESLRGRADLAFDGSPEPAFATVEARALRIQGVNVDGAVAVGRAQASLRAGAGALTYDVALSLADLTFEGLGAAALDRIGSVEIDGTATFDRPLTESPRLVALALRRAEIVWDGGRADLSGAIEVAPSGVPDGALTLTVEGWRDLLALLAAQGLPPGQAILLAGGIAGMERDGRVELPLTLSGGMLRFGAIPLAPLPRLPAPYSP